MQQSPLSSSTYFYPSSPTPSVQYYDSAYSSYNYSTPSTTSFHFTSCPYSNDSYYMPSPFYPPYQSPTTYTMQQPTSQSFVSSTPVTTSNVYLAPTTTNNVQSKRRQQQSTRNLASPSFSTVRKRISDEAIERLNQFYEIKKRPTEAEKDQLATECNITLSQVNTWFNNARSRRGDTNPKLAQKVLRQQIDSLHNQVALLQQHQTTSSSLGHVSF